MKFLKYIEKHLKKDIDIWSTAEIEKTMKVRARELAIAQN
jgi:tRNA U38,U39,U40 pseudouridine synthase TruA